MAYLVTTPIRNRKLGAFGPRQNYQPGLLHGWYRKKRGALTLGQEIPSPIPSDPITAVFMYPPAPGTPAPPPASQGSGAPVDQAYRDLITAAVQSADPLDYISPQAAIAAGLDPARVYAAWTSSLQAQVSSGKIKSPQDAIAQGWSPGVVTELWPQVAAQPKPVSWLDQAPLGIANKWLLAGGAGIVLLTGLKGRR